MSKKRRVAPPSVSAAETAAAWGRLARGPPLCHAPCVRARLSHPTVSRVPRANDRMGAPIRWYPYYRASVLPCQRRQRKGALCGIFRPARTPYRTLRFRIRLPIPCWRIGASGLWPQSRRPPHSRRRLRGGVSYVSAQRHHISEAPFRQEAKESRRLRRDLSRCNKPSSRWRLSASYSFGYRARRGGFPSTDIIGAFEPDVKGTLSIPPRRIRPDSGG